MQEAKSAELLRERNKMDQAARIIVRCVRNYGKTVRKGMGFTLRRQGASAFRLFARLFLLALLLLLFADDFALIRLRS